MVLSIARAALRRRPFSVIATFVLVVLYAAFLYIPVHIALVSWVLASLLATALWLLLETRILEYAGCRKPTYTEVPRLHGSAQRLGVDILIAEDGDGSTIWIGSGVRAIVISRGAFETLDDDGLLGLIEHAAAARESMPVVSAGMVWLGNAPLLLAWCLSFGLIYLGKLLALTIGAALVLPIAMGGFSFVNRVGVVIGGVLLALSGAVLVSGGEAALGLGLLLSWALVPGPRELLAWESRRIEAMVDAAMIRDGSGRLLLAGLDQLMVLGTARPSGLLGFLVAPGARLDSRINRVSSALHGT